MRMLPALLVLLSLGACSVATLPFKVVGAAVDVTSDVVGGAVGVVAGGDDDKEVHHHHYHDSTLVCDSEDPDKCEKNQRNKKHDKDGQPSGSQGPEVTTAP